MALVAYWMSWGPVNVKEGEGVNENLAGSDIQLDAHCWLCYYS